MSVLSETFAEQLQLRDGFVFALLGGAQIEMRIGDQADPGMQDSSDPGLHALVSQVPVEMVISPTDQHGRVSQVPVEIVISALGRARLSQITVEFVSPTAQASLRGAQITINIF